MSVDPWQGFEKIIVCGSRSFRDRELLTRTMDRLTRKFPRLIVLSGGAVGADGLGEEWAFSWWWTVMRYHPDYDTHGKKAPLVRNSEMAAYATRCVAFWDNKSPG